MTVRKILELIDLIKLKIGANSFSQILQDYIVTIENNANNLVLLKELTDRSILEYEKLLNDNLREMLERVLVSSVKPFVSIDFLKQLLDLKAQKIIDPANQYDVLYGILTTLQAKVNTDIAELDKLRTTLEPFLSKDYGEIQKEDNAIFAIVFNNNNSFNNLKSFSFELKNWDRGLLIYQQVISEQTPEAFEIIEIDQGSIEVVINVIFDVGEKLLELFKIGLEVYGSYLTYKTIIHENLFKSFRGNEELLKLEEERERLLLSNVRIAVKEEIKKQAKTKLKQEALEKKIEEVTKLVTDHIIKGNSIKLLSAPKEKEEILEKEEEKEEFFIKNKVNYSKLDVATKQLLIETYTTNPEVDDYVNE